MFQMYLLVTRIIYEVPRYLVPGMLHHDSSQLFPYRLSETTVVASQTFWLPYAVLSPHNHSKHTPLNPQRFYHACPPTMDVLSVVLLSCTTLRAVLDFPVVDHCCCGLTSLAAGRFDQACFLCFLCVRINQLFLHVALYQPRAAQLQFTS